MNSFCKKKPQGLDFANAKSAKTEIFKEITLVISNQCGNYKKNFCGKIIKTLFAVLTIIALLSFVSLATSHIDHNCTGEDCAVCLTIEIARISLRSMITAVAVFAISLHFTLTKRSVSAKSKNEKVETLVTEKIKLID